MRRFPLLLALLLLAAIGLAASAHATQLPAAPGEVTSILPLAVESEEEGEEAEEPEEAEEAEPEEEEICEPDPELEELCEEEGPAASECLLKKASATVTANPGKRRLRLSVHYRTLGPATVVVETSLRGSKGVLYLGSEHARFRRSGVYRDTFALPERKMKRALAARDFEVELQVVGTPPSCRIELSAHRAGARKLVWS